MLSFHTQSYSKATTFIGHVLVNTPSFKAHKHVLNFNIQGNSEIWGPAQRPQMSVEILAQKLQLESQKSGFSETLSCVKPCISSRFCLVHSRLDHPYWWLFKKFLENIDEILHLFAQLAILHYSWTGLLPYTVFTTASQVIPWTVLEIPISVTEVIQVLGLFPHDFQLHF